MFAGDDETTHHGLTDYELERVAHIRRNREIMKQLGLGDHDIVRAARERCGDVGDASSTKKKTKKRNRDGVGDDVGDGNGNGNGDDDAGNDQKSTKKKLKLRNRRGWDRARVTPVTTVVGQAR